MFKTPLQTITAAAAALGGVLALVTIPQAQAQYYERSYALVVGIDAYPSANWPKLQYAKRDAQGVARFLLSQGFEVITLLDAQATKTAIIARMQNDLARRVKKNDRVLFFFAGHGYTEELGDEDFGYIVPYDGGEISATYISMEELRAQSDKMKKAKHQLFILDACYGGLFGTRGAQGKNPKIPNYLKEITKRSARQFITAGGKDQQVLDGAACGHSFFTCALLEALQDGLGDTNNDGYITFSELTGYLIPRASNDYQTPAAGTLPRHGLGEFVFRSPKPAIDTTKGYGSLKILVIPYGAIYIDGKLRRADDDKQFIISLPAGTHQVEAVHPTYGSWETPVEIAANEEREVVSDFTKTVKLTVASQPVWGEIYIDGIATGYQTPRELELRPGKHVIEVRREGYVAPARTINLVQDVIEPILFRLEKTP
jgi:hypothetical protein